MGNGNVQIDFNYEPADMALDHAFVEASNSYFFNSCGYENNQVLLTQISPNEGKWRITYNRNNCGYEGDLMMANTTVYFSEGRRSGSDFLVMKRQKIDVVCRYDSFYTVEFDFGMNKTLEKYASTALTSGGIEFRLD